MSTAITKRRSPLFWILTLLALEGLSFVRWLFFGQQSSPFDWQFPVGLVVALWGIGQIAEALERRDLQAQPRTQGTELPSLTPAYKQFDFRLREIETRLEALYKWGNLYPVDEGKDDPTDQEQEKEDVDEDTKAKIAEYRASLNEGGYDYSYHLGVIYWNLAMKHYNPRTMDGYRKAIYWLRKSSNFDFDCDSTLAEAYQEIGEYDKAMLWYRRVAKRGEELAYYAESSIAGMYAEGQGVLQNHAEAARWWTLAAQHGHRFANYDLGKLYAEGAAGVALDNREAYFHLFIASSAKELSGISEQVLERRDRVAKHLSALEIAEEEQRANQWLARHAKLSKRRKVNRLPLPM